MNDRMLIALLTGAVALSCGEKKDEQTAAPPEVTVEESLPSDEEIAAQAEQAITDSNAEAELEKIKQEIADDSDGL